VVELLPLVLDHRLDQVADRQHADHCIAFQHRQVADAVLGHHLHAAVRGVGRGHTHHARGHDVGDRRVER